MALAVDGVMNAVLVTMDFLAQAAKVDISADILIVCYKKNVAKGILIRF